MLRRSGTEAGICRGVLRNAEASGLVSGGESEPGFQSWREMVRHGCFGLEGCELVGLSPRSTEKGKTHRLDPIVIAAHLAFTVFIPPPAVAIDPFYPSPS